MRDSTGVDLLGKVDGRNSGPVDMVDIPLFVGFHTVHVWWLAGFLPTVVRD